MEISEKRKDPRKECFTAVKFAFDDKVYTEVIRNISKGGMFIDCSQELTPKDNILLSYHLPEQKPVMRMGQIAWSDSTGMGIRFSGRDRDILNF